MRLLDIIGGFVMAAALGIGTYKLTIIMLRGAAPTKTQPKDKTDDLQ